MTDSDSPYLFFYGSLKRAFSFQDQLGISSLLRYVAEAQIEGQLYDLGNFPGMIPGAGFVKGEIYEMMDPSILDILDQYEGYDPDSPETSLYRRELYPFGERLAWVYWYLGEVAQENRIETGIWSKEPP